MMSASRGRSTVLSNTWVAATGERAPRRTNNRFDNTALCWRGVRQTQDWVIFVQWRGNSGHKPDERDLRSLKGAFVFRSTRQIQRWLDYIWTCSRIMWPVLRSCRHLAASNVTKGRGGNVTAQSTQMFLPGNVVQGSATRVLNGWLRCSGFSLSAQADMCIGISDPSMSVLEALV